MSQRGSGFRPPSLLPLEDPSQQLRRPLGYGAVLPVLERDSPALFQIGGEIPLQPLGKTCISHCKVYLVVDAEGTVVEVRRSDYRPTSIHANDFRMDHRGLISYTSAPAFSRGPYPPRLVLRVKM